MPVTVTTRPPGMPPHQQQHQVVVVQAPSRSSPQVHERYHAAQSRALGVTQLVLGSVAILCNCVAFYFEDVFGGAGKSYSGAGFWAGAWFIMTGIFGVIAGKNKTSCPIVTFMTLSIISVGLINLVFLGIAASGVDTSYLKRCDTGFYFTYKCGHENPGLLAMMAILLVVSLTEIVIGIWSIVIVSIVLCCTSNTSRRVHHVQQVQYYNTGRPQVIIQTGTPSYPVGQSTATTVNTAHVYPQGAQPPPYPGQQVQQPQCLGQQVQQPQCLGQQVQQPGQQWQPHPEASTGPVAPLSAWQPQGGAAQLGLAQPQQGTSDTPDSAAIYNDPPPSYPDKQQ